jgi:hypothetical protein
MTGKRVRIDFGRFPRVPIALACAGFSAFVLVLCVLAGAHFKRGVEQECYRETENIAQILMASFDDDAATADAILRRLAAEIPENDVSETHETELHRLLTRYALQPSMIGPAVLDRGGTLIASALVDPVPKISLTDRNIFRSHAETPGESKLYISSPIRGVVSNEWAIQFSRPLRDRSGALYGVVLLSYRLPHSLSNVLHHSKARTATLTASYDQQAQAIFISVNDDGCGFDPADTSAGRGLSNMRKRTASISTGAEIFIESSPGCGTTVRIELKAPPLA